MQANLDSELQLMGRFHLAFGKAGVTKIMTQVSLILILEDAPLTM
jgi:hypothetical protein